MLQKNEQVVKDEKKFRQRSFCWYQVFATSIEEQIKL